MILAYALLALVVLIDPAHADPVSAAIISAFSLTGYAATAVQIAVGLVVSVGLTFVSQALSPKPKARGMTETGVQVTSRDPIAPRRRVFGRTRVAGTLVFFGSTNDNKFLHMAIALCEGPVDAVESVLVNDEAVTLDGSGFVSGGSYAGKCRIRVHLGGADQMADPYLMAFFPEWTSEHRLRGVAWLYARLEWDQNVWTGGLPNITAVVRGERVFDPRSGSTAWSENTALILRHVLTLPARDGGVGALASEIDDTNFAAAANICDETVALAGGGTEARYAAAGVLDLGEGNTPQEIVQSLLTACGGTLTFVGGKWRVYPAAWRSPSFAVTDSILRGPISVETRISRRAQFNAVKGTYSSPADRYVMRDYPAITSAAFEAEDGGTRITKELKFDWTTSAARAQRLAKIELYRSREPITCVVQCNLSAYPVTVGDVVSVTHERFGWSAKPFEVSDVRWSQEEDGLLGIDLTLRETSAAVYDWSASEEQLVAAAPATALPNWSAPIAPNGLTITEELYEARGSSGVRNRVKIAFPTSPDAFVTGFDAAYRLSGTSDWINLPRVIAPPAIADDLAKGLYEFRVRSVNALGAVSTWTTTTKEIFGLAAAPTPPGTLSLQAAGGLAVLRWPRSPDLDVRIGGRVVVKHAPATAGVTWDTATSAAEPLPGDSTLAVLPLQTGTYLVDYVDSSGIRSGTAAAVTSEQASVLAFAQLSSLTEHSGFLGTKTNCTVASGQLQLSSGQTDGTYAFSAGLSAGALKTVRVTRTLAAVAFNPSDQFDSAELFDSSELFDGGTVDADAWVEMRTSPTDPNGSPVWSEWRRIDAAEVRAWGFEFRARLVAASGAENVAISQLSVKIEERV